MTWALLGLIAVAWVGLALFVAGAFGAGEDGDE